MTEYAYEVDRHALTTSWETGGGRITNTFTTFPPDMSAEDALRIAYALSNLSKQLWHCYSDVANLTKNVNPSPQDLREQEEHGRFSAVIEALQNPNLPQNGYIL